MRSWTPIGGLPHGSVPALAPSLPLLGHPLQPPAVRDNPRLSHPHTFPVGARGLVLFLLDRWTAACRGGVTRGTCSRVRHPTGGLCQRAFPALPPHWRRGAVRRGLAGHAHAPLPSLALICRNQMQTADHPNAILSSSSSSCLYLHVQSRFRFAISLCDAEPCRAANLCGCRDTIAGIHVDRSVSTKSKYSPLATNKNHVLGFAG